MARTRVDTIDLHSAARYRETFAPETPELNEGDDLPAGWEGVYFPFEAPFDALRADGTPGTDATLPVPELPRRMYAGEDTEFHRPLCLGNTVEQTTRLGSVVEKQGRTGRLVFADLIREYRIGSVLAIVSTWHDVFLDAVIDSASADSSNDRGLFDLDDTWQRENRVLDARHLFRFSALTYNTHRIHYDLSWARHAEGLANLLVHGPLTRVLALDAVRRLTRSHAKGRVSLFHFRSLAPLFVDRPFIIAVRDGETTTEVVVVGPEGALAARGTVTFAR